MVDELALLQRHVGVGGGEVDPDEGGEGPGQASQVPAVYPVHSLQTSSKGQTPCRQRFQFSRLVRCSFQS